MSIQTSARPVRRARPAHRVYSVPRARRGTIHQVRRVTIRQMLMAAERLGLITRKPKAKPRAATRGATRGAQHRRPRTSSSRSRVERRAQVRKAVRLVCTPGPVYFVAAMLAGMAASFLAGLWLY